MSVTLKPTRGERNNNPGNIDQSKSAWLGKVANPTDSRFEQFTEVKYGIRALTKLLLNYHSKGFNSIRKMINRYAPTVENNTSAYMSAVSYSTKVAIDDEFPVDDVEKLTTLVTAIIKHENGRVLYSSEQIKEGINLAL